MKAILSKIKSFLFGSISIIIFIVVWQLAVDTKLIPSAVIPSPTSMLNALLNSASTGDLWIHTLSSLKRASLGFLMAAAISIPLGFLLGTFFKSVEKALLPYIRLLEKLNPFALIPLFIILFGIEDMGKVVFIYWVAQFPIVFHTLEGARAVDGLLLKSARSMGASKFILFTQVILPSAVPYIFTGIKIGAQISFFMIIASEFLGASDGLGWYYLSASQYYQVPLLFGVMVFITILGIIVNLIFSALEKRFLSWKETAFHTN